MTEIQGNNRFWFEIGGCELSGVDSSSMCAHLLTLFEPTTNYKWLKCEDGIYRCALTCCGRSVRGGSITKAPIKMIADDDKIQ